MLFLLCVYVRARDIPVMLLFPPQAKKGTQHTQTHTVTTERTHPLSTHCRLCLMILLGFNRETWRRGEDEAEQKK